MPFLNPNDSNSRVSPWRRLVGVVPGDELTHPLAQCAGLDAAGIDVVTEGTQAAKPDAFFGDRFGQGQRSLASGCRRRVSE
jgi:hypothetical protein